MPNYFTDSRCCELSTIYFLETQIGASWSSVSVVKSFNQAYKESLPVVAIRLIDTDSTRREIGGNSLINDYRIAIDIFARSDGQRIDLADFIMNQLKTGWVNYTFSHASGDPETLDRVANGRIHLARFLDNRKLDLGENLDKMDKFRHFIEIEVRVSE